MSNSNSLLKGKKVLVVGGSSGIGQGVAAAALSNGASVVIASSSQAKVDTAIELLKKDIVGSEGVTVSGEALDMNDFVALKKFLTKEAPFDHFVSTAGEPPRGVGASFTADADIREQMKDSMDLRYWAVLNAANIIHKNNLIRPGGSITMTIGSLQKRPIPGVGFALGAAGALETATRALAVDMKPLRINTNREGKHLPAEHRSPLQLLFSTTEVNVSEYAPRARSVDLQKTLLKLKVTIAESREEAIEFEKATTADVKIFTDGSMKDGGVGAAAVLIREGAEDRTLKVYLGSDEEHEVYEAEIIGLQLGLRLLETERWPVEDAVIFMDNQAVLRTLEAGRTKQLSNMFADMGSLLRRVNRQHGQARVEARWIPGHEGVAGNEKADEAARDAGEGCSSASELLPEHLRGHKPINPTAAKRVFRKLLLRRWKEEVDETRKERLQNLDPTYPSLDFFQSARTLCRRDYAILVQLRLEHFPVAVYLHRFKKVDSPICPNCKLQDQTIFHALMTCPAHKEERAVRTQALGDASRSFRALLEPGKATEHLMRYLERIGLL